MKLYVFGELEYNSWDLNFPFCLSAAGACASSWISLWRRHNGPLCPSLMWRLPGCCPAVQICLCTTRSAWCSAASSPGGSPCWHLHVYSGDTWPTMLPVCFRDLCPSMCAPPFYTQHCYFAVCSKGQVFGHVFTVGTSVSGHCRVNSDITSPLDPECHHFAGCPG